MSFWNQISVAVFIGLVLVGIMVEVISNIFKQLYIKVDPTDFTSRGATSK